MTFLNTLKHNGNTLSTTNASATKSPLLVQADKVVRQVTSDTSTRCTEWVTNSDSSTEQVGLVVGELELLGDSEPLTSKGLVDVDEVHLANALAGTLEGLANRDSRSDTHDAGLTCRPRVSSNTGDGLDAVLLHGVLGHDDVDGSTITDTRGVTSSNGTSLGDEDRGELLQAGKRGVGLGVLVLVDDGVALASLDGDWRNLILEGAVGETLLVALLTLESVVVTVLTADTVFLSEVLGCDTHGRGLATVGVLVSEGGEERVLELLVNTEAHAVAV